MILGTRPGMQELNGVRPHIPMADLEGLKGFA